MTFYQPVPLNSPEVELRLAILHPAEEYCSIHCDLVTVNPDILDAYEVTFEALSYCWGKDVATNTIFIDGLSFQVTPNLDHALRHLRSRTTARILWIDAICINQKDIAERNAQVPRMGWIYSNAAEVLIWIGKDVEEEDRKIVWDSDIWPLTKYQTRGSATKTKLAFQFLKNLAWFFQQSIASNPHFTHIMMLVDMCKDVENCVNVARLLRRQWFERVWVIQEAVLSKKSTVICGHASISWATLDEASKAMVNNELTAMISPDHPFFSMIGQHRISRIADCSHKRGIFPLLEATQSSKFSTMALRATDARDKLFGLLGMMEIEDAQDITVNYNISTMDVYRSWVQKRILRTGNLDTLSICANTGRRGFPSWVPDLNHRLPNDQSLFGITHSISPGLNAPPPMTKYRASASVHISPKFDTKLFGDRTIHTLHLQGIQLGVVHFIAPQILPDLLPPSGDIQNFLDQLENMLLSSHSVVRRRSNMSSQMISSSGEKQLLLELGTTLFRGYTHANIECSLQAMYECFRHRNALPSLLTTSWPPTKTQQFYANFGTYTRTFLWFSRFFVTSQGYFGVIGDNCNVVENDEIWVLKGGKTPFILRNIDVGKNFGENVPTREILGPCYVYGCMDGQQVPSAWETVKQARKTEMTSSPHSEGEGRDIIIV